MEEIDLNELTEEHALELLVTEWKHNNGKFINHKGSPAKMKAYTNDGQVYLDACDALIAIGRASISQIRFFYACNHAIFR